MIKKEFVRSKSEEEYIDLYIEAEKIIAENSRVQNTVIKFTIKDYSLAFPCIFLCCQALELSIKRSIRKKKLPYAAIHSEIYRNKGFCEIHLSEIYLIWQLKNLKAG